MPPDEPKPPVAAPPINQASFSLATLLLLMTLVAVCVGVFAQWPGIGIILAVLAVPALVRTIGIQRRFKQAGASTDAGGKIVTFLASFAVATVIAVASCAAFVVTCFPLGLALFEGGYDQGGDKVLWIAVPAGLVAAAAVAFSLYRLLWRRWGR